MYTDIYNGHGGLIWSQKDRINFSTVVKIYVNHNVNHSLKPQNDNSCHGDQCAVGC